MRKRSIFILTILGFLLILPVFAAAQTTEFTYQGRLNDGANPANASYDFEFRLYDAASGGTQIGPTLTRTGVAVAAGAFTVNLDFGNGFPGADRYLDVRVQIAGGGGYTDLTPRQRVTSVPYAFKALVATSATGATNAATATNALQLGGVSASQFVQTTDARLADARPPTAASANYIQNQNAVVQPVSNFLISGNGTAGGTLSGNVLNAGTQLNIGGLRAFTINGRFNDNPFLGATSNVFAGDGAGANTTPHPESQFVNGKVNSFFGARAGFANLEGYGNSFFGANAGSSNTGGDENSFFGRDAGKLNNGNSNSFFGTDAGQGNTSGFGNTFIGLNTGRTNSTGARNTALGYIADVSPNNLRNATAIGAFALATQSNSLILGSINGVNFCDPFDNSCDSVNVGIGTTAPASRLHVVGGSDAEPGGGGYIVIGPTTSSTTSNIVIDNNEIMARLNAAPATLAINADGGNVNLIQGGTGSVGIGTSTPGDKLDVDGDIRVGTSGTNGCLKNNNGGAITGTCSSDARFKRGITPFRSVLGRVSQLRPVHYFWRENDFPSKDFGPNQTYGLLAQDVEKVLPELVSTDDKGFKQVDYGKLPMLTIQAIRELNEQNTALKLNVEEQTRTIAALRKLVCRRNAKEPICRR